MSRKLQGILIIVLFSLIFVGCKSKENSEVTMFCSECLNESTVSKYCPECGVEAKWLTEKPKENEIEEKKVEDFIDNAKTLFNEGKYEDVKTYLNENIISEDGNNIKNKYTTDEQKKRALELYKNCNDKIEEMKAEDVKNQEKKTEEVKKQEHETSKESTVQEEKGTCFICNKKDYISNLNEIRGFGVAHMSCYNNAPVCSICHQTKLILNEDSDGNGICDYNCDNLCTNCWSNEANVKGGLCNDCEWNKYYSNKATCGGCIGNIVDGSLAGTTCPECGNKFELMK